MTIARRNQVCLEVTPVYHCVTWCVRRSYLCGYDTLTRRNCDHRLAWIEDRLLLLAEVFCVEILGYSIMCNHYHVILKVKKDKADQLSDEEVIARWLKLYKGTELVRPHVSGELLMTEGLVEIKKTIRQWRDNLSNISRFMGNLNEYIARNANKEDGCKGSFRESRFKLQAVLGIAALLQTMCYVDLNPVRAKMAKTPEESKYTSVRRRLHRRRTGLVKFNQSNHIDSFAALNTVKDIPISFKAYLELLDWTGRQLKIGKPD